MANSKISQLVSLITPADDDVLAIVDTSATETKKIAKSDLVSGLQAELVSGTNIKTINSESLLGSGDITISGGGSPAGTAGQIQFSDGSAFAADSNLYWDNTNKQIQIGGSDATGTIGSGIRLRPNLPTSSSFGANIFSYYNNDKWLQISKGNSNYYTFADAGLGINLGQFGIPTARLHIKGSGNLSATTSLLVQNSSGTQLLKVTDDGKTTFGGALTISSNLIYDGINGDKSFYISGNTTVASNYQAISLRVFNGTAYGSGLEVVGNNAESRVGIGTTSPNDSAKLQLDSTTKGFLPPRMTTTQKNAISSPAAGLQVYDSTLNQMSYYNGSTWVNF